MDMKDIKGCWHEKRAIEIAAAGLHPILFIGGIGTGKTTLVNVFRDLDIPTIVYEGVTDLGKKEKKELYDTISRREAVLVAGTSFPCPCGEMFNKSRTCNCSLSEVKKYRAKFLGAADYIPIHLVLTPLHKEDMILADIPDSTSEVRKRVSEAHKIIKDDYGCFSNQLTSEQLADIRKLVMSEDAAKLLGNAYERMHMNYTQYDNVIRVALTISVLSGSDKIEARHVAEAVQYAGKHI